MPPEAELSSIAYGHSLSGLDSSRMETITQYVRAQLYETVSQSEAARVTGMSVARDVSESLCLGSVSFCCFSLS